MKKRFLMALSIVALAGLIIPSTGFAYHEDGHGEPRCVEGDLTFLEGHPADRNKDDYICVLRTLEIPSENAHVQTIYVATDNLICPPDCGGSGL